MSDASPVLPKPFCFSLYLIENQDGTRDDPRGSLTLLQLSNNDSLAKEEALR